MFLGLGGLVATTAGVIIVVFQISAWLGMPLGIFGTVGFNEGPDQPIAFPHTTHVQTLGLDCTFCHRTVTSGAAASIPPVSLCMSCHKTVGDGNEEIAKLRQAHDQNNPIDWVRVHRVPDHVHFIHEAHVNFFSGSKVVVEQVSDRSHIRLDEASKIKPGTEVGDRLEVSSAETCVVCHGDVGAMAKVKQVRALKMGDCVDCHRSNSFLEEATEERPERLFARTDCTTCHY